MDNSSLRSIIFWVTLISGIVWLVLSMVIQVATLGMTRPMNSNVEVYAEVFGVSLASISLLGLAVGTIHTSALLLFLSLLHRDLGTCERWVEFERGRLVSGKSGRLADDPGAGAVGGPDADSV